MRIILTFFSLLLVSGCANSPVTGGSETVGQNVTNGPVTSGSKIDLPRLVGQDVTLSGKFELYGKVGPYIYCGGQPVYLVPQGSFTWGSKYDSMEGKEVSIGGVLHFRHFERVMTGNAIARAVDYYYFDAETAKVELK